jgi:hypothetical protein
MAKDMVELMWVTLISWITASPVLVSWDTKLCLGAGLLVETTARGFNVFRTLRHGHRGKSDAGMIPGNADYTGDTSAMSSSTS